LNNRDSSSDAYRLISLLEEYSQHHQQRDQIFVSAFTVSIDYSLGDFLSNLRIAVAEFFKNVV
jgi:hypothetical protein